MNLVGLVYGKYNFNRYGTILSFISNFLREGTDNDEIIKCLMSLKTKSMN